MYKFDPCNLRKLIKRTSLSISQIAREADVQRTSLSKWLNGYMEPSLRNAVLLADFFNVSVDELIGRKPIQD
ncbi:helix-turn-helix transcriptional regulator [Candidatus Saccharibacteria bacterium]|nr:helix-turn-helix transcriptional regulator [Candidatus Saccharibacteria bacterium]